MSLKFLRLQRKCQLERHAAGSLHHCRFNQSFRYLNRGILYIIHYSEYRLINRLLSYSLRFLRHDQNELELQAQNWVDVNAWLMTVISRLMHEKWQQATVKLNSLMELLATSVNKKKALYAFAQFQGSLLDRVPGVLRHKLFIFHRLVSVAFAR